MHKTLISLSFLLVSAITNASPLSIKIDSEEFDSNYLLLSNSLEGSSQDNQLYTKLKDNLEKINGVQVVSTNQDCASYHKDKRVPVHCLVVTKRDQAGLIPEYQFSYENIDFGHRKNSTLGLAMAAGVNSIANDASDFIYKKIFNRDSFFKERVAYVSKTEDAGGSMYRILVSDFDGRDTKISLKSREPVLNPVISPDGKYLTYTSFERVRSSIFIQEISTGKRKLVASYKGVNAHPSWSPDGTKIVMTLSRLGSPDLYVYDVYEKTIQRITSGKTIESNPTWLNNNLIVYTLTTKYGSALYEIDLDKGTNQRIKLKTTNVFSPRANPSTNTIYAIFAKAGNYGLLKYSVNNGRETVILTDEHIESPSVSKNGDIIVYSTKGTDGKRVLRFINNEGEGLYKIASKTSELYEANW